MALFQEIARLKPEDTFITRQIAFTHLVTAATYAALDRHEEALERIRQGMDICDSLIARDGRNVSAWRTLATLAQYGGGYAVIVHRKVDAARLYTSARDAWHTIRDVSGPLAALDAKRLAAVETALTGLRAAR